MKDRLRANVMADASYCHEAKIAGFACWVTIIGDPTYKIKKRGLFQSVNTPYEAEYFALIEGISIAHREGASIVYANTDCKTLVDNIRRGRAPLSGFGGMKLNVYHIKGHTSASECKGTQHVINRWCDSNARKAMQKARQHFSVTCKRKGL